MVEFWLDSFKFDLENFNLQTIDTNKLLNIVSLIVLLSSLLIAFNTKNVFYFGIGIIILSVIIVLKYSTTMSNMIPLFGNNMNIF